jgi:hypothetical protein
MSKVRFKTTRQRSVQLVQMVPPSGTIFLKLLSPGSNETRMLIGNKDLDTRKENASNLCLALVGVTKGVSWASFVYCFTCARSILILFVLLLISKIPTFSMCQPRSLSWVSLQTESYFFYHPHGILALFKHSTTSVHLPVLFSRDSEV